jgi:D-tyrosyl-tRNA(Tyr) deacylase
MIALIQRVSSASVTINNKVTASINAGLLVLLGIQAEDSEKDAKKLAGKTVSLRVFDDDNGDMNLNIKSIDGDILVVPNFTLAADTSRGNRPGFSTAMPPSEAEPLFELFTQETGVLHKNVQTGVFGADMQVSLVNDGPITISLETKKYML